MNSLRNTSIFILQITVVLVIFFRTNPAVAQTYPQDLDYSPRIETLLDAGVLWNINSLYHPLTCYSPDSSSESSELETFSWLENYLLEYTTKATQPTDTSRIGLNILIASGIGLNYQAGAARAFEEVAFQPYFWLQAKFRNNWYSRIYIRATNEKESLPHFTGVPRDISRLGLNTGEIDQSVIGYQDKWVNVEYGRSREIWGPMVENNLILSGETPAYERLMTQLKLGRFTLRYQFGFLETIYDEEFINRYIVGKCLQYSNNKNLLIGIQEVSILMGPNRNLDLAYLNPLQFHLETDLNKRSTSSVLNYNNAIWTIHFDWLPLKSLRLSGSIAMDEFQLDQQDRNEGRPDVMGYLIRTSWTPLRKYQGLTLIAKYIKLDTYFGQHDYKYANFVDRGSFIGHPIGNDADQISAAVRMVFRYPLMMEIELGRRRWGDNSLLSNPYTIYPDFVQVSFPSGEKRENHYLTLKLNSQPLKYLSFSLDGQIDLSHSGEASSLEKYNFIIRYQLPIYLIKI